MQRKNSVLQYSEHLPGAYLGAGDLDGMATNF